MYYQLFANNSEIPSKVSFDPEEPSLGRIRADSVAPPHSLASIKLRISRVEETPALANADLFADISNDAPMDEGYISILGTDGLGLTPDEPMSIVLAHAESPLIPDGTYFIKNRAADIFWSSWIIFKTVTFQNGTQTSVYPNRIDMIQVNEHSLIIPVFKL